MSILEIVGLAMVAGGFVLLEYRDHTLLRMIEGCFPLVPTMSREELEERYGRPPVPTKIYYDLGHSHGNRYGYWARWAAVWRNNHHLVSWHRKREGWLSAMAAAPEIGAWLDQEVAASQAAAVARAAGTSARDAVRAAVGLPVPEQPVPGGRPIAIGQPATVGNAGE